MGWATYRLTSYTAGLRGIERRVDEEHPSEAQQQKRGASKPRPSHSNSCEIIWQQLQQLTLVLLSLPPSLQLDDAHDQTHQSIEQQIQTLRNRMHTVQP